MIPTKFNLPFNLEREISPSLKFSNSMTDKALRVLAFAKLVNFSDGEIEYTKS
jgi:hypothetical protein